MVWTKTSAAEGFGAADSLRSGIEDIPTDQREAEWMDEYRQALAYADEST
jgi:hypothetical protein